MINIIFEKNDKEVLNKILDDKLNKWYIAIHCLIARKRFIKIKSKKILKELK